mgnify:CR=1
MMCWASATEVNGCPFKLPEPAQFTHAQVYVLLLPGKEPGATHLPFTCGRRCT